MALTETGFVFAPRIPRGLGPAVEGLAREILRHRPRDVYAFAARHFEELIDLREKERDAIDVVVSTTAIRDCELPYSGGVRGPDYGAWNDSKSCDERTRIRKIVDLMEESARKESTKSLKRRRKESAARNRSGWSVTETVKAFEKHGDGNDVERRNRNRKLEKTGSDYFEQCSPRSSKIAQYRYLRSSSAGDILAKIVGSRRSREHRGKVCERVPPRRATEAFEEDAGCKKTNVDLAETVKRRKSGDQFERSCTHVESASETGCDGRGKCLATDESEREDHRLLVEEFDVCRNRQDRPEASVDDRTELSNCEKTFRGTVSNDDDFNEINVITIDRRVSEGSMPIDRYSYTENSVLLPSVARPSSSNGSSRSGIQNDVPTYSNDLILPPISSDAARPTDREDNVTLPLLSKVPEIPVDRRATQNVSCEREDFKLENVEQLLETRDPLIASYDYDSIDTDTGHRVTVTDNEERDPQTDTAIDGVPLKDERADDEDDDNNDNETLGVLETVRASNWPEAEVEEIFRDSLNVTPDSVEFLSERTDSLERLTAEEAADKESRQPNELKKKLIEIETVERSIENTLASSGTIVGRNEESVMSNFDLDESVPLNDERENACRNRSSEAEREESKENIAIDLIESGKLESSLASFENNENEIKHDDDESNVRVTTEEPLKEIDLSCYVLTDDVSPCEIPESVTTVIIPDTRPSDDEAAFNSDRERTENDSDWDRETRQESCEQLPSGDENKDPFGEYVSPTSNAEYSTNIEPVFLNGIRNAVDRKVVRRDTLRDIREEEESGREGPDTEDARFMVLPGDTGCPVPLDSQFLGSENASLKSTITTIDSTNLDQDAVDDRETTSSPISNASDARNESLNKERRNDTDTQTEVDRTPSEDCPRPCREPFVPELNLDSLRDATISSSSFERNDSRNCSSRSEKENDYDVTFHQGGEISTDTPPVVPFETETVVDHREDRGAKIENESDESCKKDGDSIEEEIAKELIRNLSFDAPSPSSSSTSKVIDENREECEAKNASYLEKSNDSLDGANWTSDFVDPAMLCPSIETSSPRTDDSQRREKEDGARINGALHSTEDEKIGREETLSSSLLESTSPLNRDRCQEHARDLIVSNDQRQPAEVKQLERSVAEIMHGVWLTIRNEDSRLEADRSTASPTASTGLRQTVERRDSFPLPILQLSRNDLCVVDLSKNLGQTSAFCIVRLDTLDSDLMKESRNALTDTILFPLKKQILASDFDDVREPLALIDETAKESVLIEEISNVDENKRQLSLPCLRRGHSYSFELSPDREDSRGRTKMSRKALSVHGFLGTGDNDLRTDGPLDYFKSESEKKASSGEESKEKEEEEKESTVTESQI